MRDTCCVTPTLKRYIGIYIDIEEISRDAAIEPLTSVGLMSSIQSLLKRLMSWKLEFVSNLPGFPLQKSRMLRMLSLRLDKISTQT